VQIKSHRKDLIYSNNPNEQISGDLIYSNNPNDQPPENKVFSILTSNENQKLEQTLDNRLEQMLHNDKVPDLNVRDDVISGLSVNNVPESRTLLERMEMALE